MSISRVTVVADGFPYKPRSGSQLRSLGILKALKKAVDSVSLVSLVGPETQGTVDTKSELDGYSAIECHGLEKLLFAGVNMATLGRSPVRRLLPEGKRGELVRAVMGSSPGLVLLDSSYLAPLAPYMKGMGNLVAVDCHNHDSALYRDIFHIPAPPLSKLRRYLEYRGYLNVEGRLNDLADQVWVPTPQEKLGLLSAGVEHVFVVPNVVDVAAYSPKSGSGHVVGFPGSLWYPPNQEAVGILLHSVFPDVQRRVPDAKLVLAGSNPPGWIRRSGSAGVRVLGDVADMRPCLEKFSVVAAPILTGGGTKLKVIEAMAMGKVVVTTPKGVEGLEVNDGEHVIVRDVENFAGAVAEALTDEGLRERIGKKARTLVEERYSVEALVGPLSGVLGGHG